MKKHIIIIFMCILTINLYSASNKIKSDVEKLGLKGKVSYLNGDDFEEEVEFDKKWNVNS